MVTIDPSHPSTTTATARVRAGAARKLAEELAASASDRSGSAAEALAAAVDGRVADDPTVDVDLLVAAAEHLAGATRRGPGSSVVLTGRPQGVVYTPPDLAGGLVDLALGALGDLSGSPRVVDPACGGGVFLVASLRRLSARHPLAEVEPVAARRAVLGQLTGIDLDPVAAHVARVALRLEVGDPDLDPAVLERVVRITDTLTLTSRHLGRVDVVVGNPPFRSPLHRITDARPAGARWADGLGAYADDAVAFLAWAHHVVAPDGGRVLLVQPASVLGSGGAAGLRRRVDAAGELAGLWIDTDGAFDAAVHTVAPLIVRGTRHTRVRLWHRRDVVSSGASPPRAWTSLAAGALGAPPIAGGSGVLGEHASATADFRDQYYGLVGHVVDLPPGTEADRVPDGLAPLVTSGLVDPATNAWGRRPVRLHRRGWAAPAVDLASLTDGPLATWAAQRLVPKVLVAAQTRVVEAVVDESGRWLPSVPVITVTGPPERLWHLAAALCSPTSTAHALHAGVGTARSIGALKLSARQVASLPAPVDAERWDAGAEALRAAARAVQTGDRAGWLATMAGFGHTMAEAYATSPSPAEELVAWWLDRLPDPFR